MVLYVCSREEGSRAAEKKGNEIMTINKAVGFINRNRNLRAAIESAENEAREDRYGLILVELLRKSNGVDPVADEIEREIGEETKKHLKFVDSDEASNLAWFEFV